MRIRPTPGPLANGAGRLVHYRSRFEQDEWVMGSLATSLPRRAISTVRVLLALAIGLAAALSGHGAVAETAQNGAVIVIDGSGSMWGPIGNERAAKNRSRAAGPS